MPTQTRPAQNRPMPMVPTIADRARDGREQLIRHVQGEIKELKGEITMLEGTLHALKGDGHAVSRTGNGGKTTSRRKTPTRARTRNGGQATSRSRSRGQTITEETVFEALRAGMGHQSPQLATGLHASRETILRRLKALEAKGMIRREGERRNIRWVIARGGP